MVTLVDVVAAVSTVLRENFPGIELESGDIEEGYTAPCFYTDWDGMDSSHIGEDMSDDNLIARIYYFPEDKHKNEVELIDMQESLKKAFGSVLKVNNDFFIPIDQISFPKRDKVLIAEMELRYIQLVPEDDGELIEELEFNFKEGEL